MSGAQHAPDETDECVLAEVADADPLGAACRSDPERAPMLVPFLLRRRTQPTVGVDLLRGRRGSTWQESEGDREGERECSKASLHGCWWGGDTDRACHRPQFKSNLRHDRVSWLLAAPPFPLGRRVPLLRLPLLLLLLLRGRPPRTEICSGR